MTIRANASMVVVLFIILGLGATLLSEPLSDEGNIGGIVRSSAGPEGGVWVIAETDSFDTRLRKIVVTDDEGRFLLPGLPAASYQVWVRVRTRSWPCCLTLVSG